MPKTGTFLPSFTAMKLADNPPEISLKTLPAHEFSVPPEVPRTHNFPDFDPEKPTDPPPLSPNPAPEFPGPPKPDPEIQPPGPEMPVPPNTPGGPEVVPPEWVPPNTPGGPEVVPPEWAPPNPPDVGPITPPEIPLQYTALV
ncbi:hypothetical protein L1987_71689 [Smallanthus sonchifolius]|uniref:Uncharacterized protein n=1 Tax=Smallanthus sonchifolius TaxID=185202 RepID=A0ACB9ASJ1_9ASTR|nr:hypothetical protein L1987_71689 [Smallanthus sonchifolius]